MTPAAALARLTACMEAEIAALGAGDLDALGAATRAKLEALRPLADPGIAAALPHADIAAAAELNREAARRVNRARARIDRRLDALARAVGRAPAAAYGPDGRLTARVLRP